MLASFRQRPASKPHSPLEPSDARLVEQAQQQDVVALGLLYDRYARLVYTTALRSLGDVASAEDLTQDVFLTLQRRGYNPKRGSLASYLSLLTRSRAIDRLRAQSTRHKYLNQLAQQPQWPHTTPMDHATQQERHALVRAALDQLSPDQRQVLELSYYKGQSQSEIADHLGVPLGTVKSWARRGLLKLRSHLQSHLSEEP
ncbi:MAG: sigma-70 family RNA polymerase sigma factor [Cyanobacteria bacterium J06632_22]